MSDSSKIFVSKQDIVIEKGEITIPGDLRIKSPKTLEKMTSEQRKNYYNSLADLLAPKYPAHVVNAGRSIASLYGCFSRNYELVKPVGMDNILSKSNGRPLIFVSNHSNSHDFFTVSEVCRDNNIPINIVVGTDCLNPVSNFVFNIGGAIGIDRFDKDSCELGLYKAAIKLFNKESVWIFSEATWNLHPSRLMLPIKIGVTLLALMTGAVIVPVNMEYVRSNRKWESEKDLYDKVVVTFGKPIEPTFDVNEISQNKYLYNELCCLRAGVVESLGIDRDINNPINRERYLLHNALAKDTFAFKYNSSGEELHIRVPNRHDGSFDNEYTFDYASNKLVPGYTSKKEDELVYTLKYNTKMDRVA